MVRRLSVELLTIASVGLILGLLGPFGTYPMPTALRLSYWIGFVLIGYVIFRPVTIAAQWLHEQSNIPYIAAIAMAVAVAALPLTITIGFAINGMRWDAPMLSEGFAMLYAQCAGIGVAIFLLMRLIFPRDGDGQTLSSGNSVSAGETKSTHHSDAKPKIFNRLPAGFPEPILALGVEDHYVRVHTADRSEMLLLRFSDAISEMDSLQGTQVHRSWWVSKDAIRSSKRDGRNLSLVLSNGLEIPVSRSNVGKLKQTGWI